ncbi:hypothetical protein HCN51_09170 [Nonomuraea sp. FMUSA5-5]|uniref:MFS transporter n=1 Tax=Nonomuraea composti TaxID=2720023 RepID=A0ABX1B339_9ACTN|nr:hypothetical protein [Nonomuraea sp. FMUSA5-5]NJP89613.1 hypothetical protein [Nonomuraea sp. FMUSA5-5]
MSSASGLGSLLLAPLLGVLLDRVRRRRVVPVTLAAALALTLVVAGVAAEGAGAFVVPVLLVAVADPGGLAFVIVVAGAAASAAVVFHAVETVAEPPAAVEEPPLPGAGFWREAAEGVRFTLRDPVLRAIALCLFVTGLTGEFADDMVGMAFHVLVEDVPPAEIALARMGSVYGALVLGALASVLLHRRLGAYRLAWGPCW